MSGGHWEYQSYRIDEMASQVGQALTMLAECERTLDWGLSNDTCLDCARLQVAKAVEVLFDTWYGDGPVNDPVEVASGAALRQSCERCREEETA